MENPFEKLSERLGTIESFLLSIDKRLSIPISPPSPDRYVDTKEVSEIFNVSEVSIWDWERKGLLQSYRIGRLKRFKLNEVLASPKAIERGLKTRNNDNRI